MIQGKIALIKRWSNILLNKNCVAVLQGEGKIYSKETISGYYNDLTGKVSSNTLLDDNGIAVNIISNNKKVYFPISIFQYALGLWDLYLLTNKNEYLNNFLKQCEWIRDHQLENGSWNCFGPIGYKVYTVSSMGQGEAISVLLRAYQNTHEKKWLDSAKKALEFMVIPVHQGGTLFKEGDDYVFEEYPGNDEKRSVLNGWIFSLFGIYDYLKLIKSTKYADIYLKSLETLKRHLSDYDSGFWSYYDKNGRIASPAYHNLHIALLKTLSDITNEKLFHKVADKWELYENKRLNIIYAISKKMIQKFKESSEGIIIQ